MISANEATKMTRKTRDDFWESDEGSKFIAMANDAVEQAASLGSSSAVVRDIPFDKHAWKMDELLWLLRDLGFTVDSYTSQDGLTGVTISWSST
jgi:hypothetical protein